MIKLLYTGASSACFELENTSPYASPEGYELFLNGERLRRGDTNVFSLFGLKRETAYDLSVRFCGGAEERLHFSTGGEACAVDVRGFGAVGDGLTDDTSAIRTAVEVLPAGGRLYFPAGTYLTAPLALKSHITLELAEGAALLGLADRGRYPVLPGSLADLESGEDVQFGAFEGQVKPMYQALITAEYAEDIAIIGPGTVDGNAQNSGFWTSYREDPVARPRLFFFNRCKNITVHGIHACNSPSWQFHPYFSEDLRFYNLYISAPKDSPNTDAIDPESCAGVEIIGCRFSVGDDCIAIKSGKIELALKYQQAAERHTIRNCLMEHGHGGVTLGSESAAGIRDLSVSQCYFRETDRGLRIKTRRGRGKLCDITGVVFDNITMDGVGTPVVINMWYNCCDPDGDSEYVWSRELLPVDGRTPHLGTFSFRNLKCTRAQAAACYIDGLPEAPIDEVEFQNVSIDFDENARPALPVMQTFAKEHCRLGLYLDNVKRVTVKNTAVRGVVGEALITKHCGEVVTENFGG